MLQALIANDSAFLLTIGGGEVEPNATPGGA